MNNFNYWYNEIADMPFKQDGAWVDIETGFSYASWIKDNAQVAQKRWKSNEKIQTARNTAKLFGGKALTGSAKQKAWGEKIRENILHQVSEVQAEILCTVKLFSSAKFWIENREENRKSAEFGERAEKCMELLAEANRLMRKSNQAIRTEANSNVIINMQEVNEILKERKKIIDEMNRIFKFGDTLC